MLIGPFAYGDGKPYANERADKSWHYTLPHARHRRSKSLPHTAGLHARERQPWLARAAAI